MGEQRTREDNRDAEKEEHASDRKSILGIFGVDLTVDNSLADQGERNTDCSPEEWLAASYTVDEEDDKDQVCRSMLARFAEKITGAENLLARGPMQL